MSRDAEKFFWAFASLFCCLGIGGSLFAGFSVGMPMYGALLGFVWLGLAFACGSALQRAEIAPD